MNDDLKKSLKLSVFRDEVIQSTKRNENIFNITQNEDTLKLLNETITQLFNDGNNDYLNVTTIDRSITNEFIDGQIKQQEKFLKLMGFPKKCNNDNFIHFPKEVSQRAHFKYLREPIKKLGEVGCCNYDENGITGCFKNWGFVLRKGPAAENESSGFCICCSREMIGALSSRQSIIGVSSTSTLNKFRYKYNMKSDYGNNKVVMDCVFGGTTQRFLFDVRFQEKVGEFFKHEDMTNCDEYEYTNKIGHVQESTANFGIVGFFPLFHPRGFRECVHHVIVCNSNRTKVKASFKTSGLQEVFFTPPSSKDH